MGNLSKLAKLELVRLLARHLAPWQPVRHHWDAAGAIWQARQAGGWFSPQRLDGTERKRRERAIDSLIEKGLLVSSSAFTPEGKRLALSWTWAYDTALLRKAIRRIGDAVKRGDCRGGELVPETLIVGYRWGDSTRPFAALQSMLQSLFADRIIESESTMLGHVFYRLLVPLDEALKAASDIITPGVDIDGDLCDAYCEVYVAARRELLADDTMHQDIGMIGIPVSDELDSGRDDCDLQRIKCLFPRSYFMKEK